MREKGRDMYYADALKICTANLAEAFGGQILTSRLAELFDEKTDSRTAEEIISGIKGKINV